VAPEGVDQATAVQLRAEAVARAMFDPSKEATLARKYEAAAERGFFRALKELRQLEKQAKAAESPAPAGSSRQELGSFLTYQQLNAQMDMLEARLDRRDAEQSRTSRPNPASASARSVPPARFPATGDSFELPFSIGRPR
jgi:hypothetical protein